MAGRSFSCLVNLATDTRLVEKPALAVLYEEGELETPPDDDYFTSIREGVGSGTITDDSEHDGQKRSGAGEAFRKIRRSTPRRIQSFAVVYLRPAV